jgi:hypothetical protein
MAWYLQVKTCNHIEKRKWHNFLLKSFSQNHLSKMCTYSSEDSISYIFETGPALICTDLLEIGIDKKIK